MGRKSSAAKALLCALAILQGSAVPTWAQLSLHRLDSILTQRYAAGDVDSTYVARPPTKWTLAARLNVSGASIEAEGIDRSAAALATHPDGQHFQSAMYANLKTTVSVSVSYLGLTLSAALNPAKLAGRYSDYEFNFNSYGRRFGFDVIYQSAKNFTGWHNQEGMQRMQRIQLPDGMLAVRTLNLNAFYTLNHRRFSYPAAFTQSYLQRRSAGSLLLAASAMGQRATLDGEQPMRLAITNVSLGAGYAYNYVPAQGWLLHISAVPTFVVFSNTSFTFGDAHVPLRYHFPEVIVTGRGAIVRHWRNTYLGISMVYNYANNGSPSSLAIHNSKWRIRTFLGIRLGKR